MIIGENAVVAANAVLLNSIGPGEIWGGVPARLLGYRDDLDIEAVTNEDFNDQ